MEKYIHFVEAVEDRTRDALKVKKEEYLNNGAFPIIDQGKSFIAGYKDDKIGLFENVPAIVFGDHTRIFKYVDFPFFIGADGVKLLKLKANLRGEINYKYLYYYLCHQNIPNTGYNRHYKWLKPFLIPLPPLAQQKEIVQLLDKAEEMIELRKKQLATLDTLAESVFYQMFGDPVTNEKGWGIVNISDIGAVVTGNTPLRSNEDYYTPEYIEWIKSDNIKTNKIFPEKAKEFLSLNGLNKEEWLKRNLF